MAARVAASVEVTPPALAVGVERRLLGLVGLGVRARTVVVGVEQVRVAVRRGRVVLALVAPDASRHSRDKVLPLLAARRVRVIEGPSAASLGSAVGRDTVAAVGIIDPSLAAGVRRLVDPGGETVRHSRSRRTR